MYLRRTTVNKDGKTHSYWRLVRSVRRGRKVVQETVAHLGELDAQGRARARRLAFAITGREQYDLFEAGSPASEPVAVRLEQVRLERARRFGDVWLGWRLWCALGLDRFCAAHMAEGREHVPWATMAAILVIARLCEPSSELHIAEDWYRRTALSDLLGVAEERVNDDRLYRALDQLLPHKAALEGHLKQRLGELFALDYELLLYDVTSTYFEGEAAANPLARRGHSRDHRSDCKQVCIGLVVTREGIPVGYEVFAGNRHDVTTVEQVVDTMESRYGQASRVWVMDRGMTSAETVAWLQGSGRRYLIGASKSELKTLAPQLVDARDWRQVRDGVEAKLCAGPDGNESFVLVRSAERRAKERAMHDRFCERIETALVRLAGRLERARKPVDRGTTERQIGRLLGRNSRAAGRTRSVSSQTPLSPPVCGWNGRRGPNGTNGRPTAKAATCCAPTSPTGRPRRCGGPISNSPKPRPPSASTRVSCRSARSGISVRPASWPTSWCASSPMSCGRRSSNGKAVPAWATLHARSFRNSLPLAAPTWSCRSQLRRHATCACAASFAPIAPRPHCSTASDYTCRNGSACA